MDFDEVPDQLVRPEWLDEFESDLGRPLRVLNLGNIANNAFQNSKIMRRAGIEADCIAYDYYHVMGTAEWEDADFKGSIGDQFYPDWWRVKFRNYSRPKWFIQGPKKFCLDYVHDKFDDELDSRQINKSWQALVLETHHENFKKSSKNSIPGNPLKWPAWLWRKVQFYIFLVKIYFQSPFLFKRRFDKQFSFLAKAGRTIFTILSLPFVLMFVLLSYVFDKLMRLIALIPKENRSNYFELRRARRKIIISNLRRRLYPLTYSTVGFAAAVFRRFFGKRFGAVFGDNAADVITEFFGIRSSAENSISVNMSVKEIQLRRAERKARRQAAQDAEQTDLSNIIMDENIQEVKESEDYIQTAASAYYSAYLYYLELAHPDHGWIVDHYQHHANKSPEDIRQDIIIAKILAKEWEGVFEYYDVVLAYSTDGILSMAGSDMPFFTYEHGTLRSIPFEDSTMGRLCATSYRDCEGLMVTNLDNLDKPDLLEMRPEQVIYLPHAVDDKKLLGYRYQHKELNPTNHDNPTFLCPARHDWGDDDPSLMKGNDKLLHAVKIVYDEGHRPNIVLFDWGRHVEKSRNLIRELGIGDVITWVKPMKKTELWKSYFSCHAIVDQFSIPAFGGVTFEGLTFSKRIITCIDEKQSEIFFGEAPPILNCSEPISIARALRSVLEDPEDTAGIGPASGRWAKRFHSSQRILDLQLEAFAPAVQQALNYDSNGEFLGQGPNIRGLNR